MASVNVHIDMRTFISSIRQRMKDAVVQSVSKPGVKTEIYTALYEESMRKVPKDTGALRESPLQNGGTSYMGVSKKTYHGNVRYPRKAHYAHGDITDQGIIYDPYTIDKNGVEEHYASDVDRFTPYGYLYDDRVKANAYPKIVNILVKEINNE